MDCKRILLKLSGETLGGGAGIGLDFEAIRYLAEECLSVRKREIEAAVVVGAGNFVRGGKLASAGVDRVTGDQMGMLATVINGMALRSVIEEMGGDATVMSAIGVESGLDRFDRRKSLERMRSGHIVILVGGTGNPYFTTDTAGALRASELGADLFLKATKVDGVYNDDPVKNPDAERYDKLSYLDFLEKKLKVMDATAVTLCMENGIPIKVFDLMKKGNTGRVLDGESLGTLIS